MPSHLLHITLDEILFGRGHYYVEVHKYLDQMQPLLQTNHRKFYHDIETVRDIYVMTGNAEMANSAYFHIILDLVSDEVGQEHAIAELLLRLRNGEIQTWTT